MAHYIEKPDALIKKIIAATFPKYKGRKIKVSTSIPSCLDSYWDGGSRDYYAFYCLDNGRTHDVHSNHPVFERGQPRDLEDGLPLRLVIVCHSYFRGKDMGLTIYANAADLAPMLPAPVELTEDEQTVLHYTSGYKSTYNGIKNYRFHEARSSTGITAERWEAAKASLIAAKFLNKAGAITAKGRNAIS